MNSTPDLWSKLRDAANSVGAGSVFPDATQIGILDDTVNGIVACDQMGADLMGVPLT